MYKDSECQTLKMKKNVIKNYSGFVRLQKFKTPGFSRAVLPFFPGLFQGSWKSRMKNNIHNDIVITIKQQCAPSVAIQY